MAAQFVEITADPDIGQRRKATAGELEPSGRAAILGDELDDMVAKVWWTAADPRSCPGRDRVALSKLQHVNNGSEVDNSCCGGDHRHRALLDPCGAGGCGDAIVER